MTWLSLCYVLFLQINGNAGAGDFVSEVEDDGMLWGLLCGCIGRYMAVFSAKLCCFADMRPYLAVFAMGEGSVKKKLAVVLFVEHWASVFLDVCTKLDGCSRRGLCLLVS